MAKQADIARKIILSPRTKKFIDLNTDLGQTQDKAFFEADEPSLLTYVSSVNIPCCVHDGNPKEIIETIVKAKSFNCAIGAHIGFPDPVNYGYEAMAIDPEELSAWLYVQIGAIRALAKSVGSDIEHVRPHGALYGKLQTDPLIARVVAETLYKINPWMILVGPIGPVLKEVSQSVGIRVAPEIYLGKRYSADGTLVGHRFHDNLPFKVIIDQARQLIQDSTLHTQDGKPLKVEFSTLHISPRLPSAIEIAERIIYMLGQPVALSAAAVGASGWL